MCSANISYKYFLMTLIPARQPKMDPDQRLAANMGEKMRAATMTLTEQGTESTP